MSNFKQISLVIAKKLVQPVITAVLAIISFPLGIGFLIGKIKTANSIAAVILLWLTASWLFNTIIFENIMQPIFKSFPDLTVTSDQLLKAWLAEAVLLVSGALLANLYRIKWNKLDFQGYNLRPALTLALGVPFAILINLSEVRSADPIYILMQTEKKLLDATPAEIETLNENSRVALHKLYKLEIPLN